MALMSVDLQYIYLCIHIYAQLLKILAVLISHVDTPYYYDKAVGSHGSGESLSVCVADTEPAYTRPSLTPFTCLCALLVRANTV